MNAPNFLQCIALGFTRAFDFNTRSRRREYWFFSLAMAIISSVLGFLFPGARVYLGHGLYYQGMSVAVSLFSLLIFVPSLSLTIRRLHDTGRSAWHVLWSFLPVVGTIILFVFMCLDSHPGMNQYGPSPKYPMAGADGNGTQNPNMYA